MGFRGMAWVGPAVFAALFLLCGQPATAAMKIATTTIPIPKDDKPTLLAGLEYGAEWWVTVTSVRVQEDEKEGADPVRPALVFLATSTRPMVQKVIIEVLLLDGLGKKIKSTKQFVIVKANTKGQEIPVKMKIKRVDWERAERVRIKTTFTVL